MRRLRDLLHRGSFALGTGGLVSALLAWVVMVVVARVAEAGDYRDFVVIWSVYFAAAGVFVGLQQQVIRAVRVGGGPGGPDALGSGPTILRTSTRTGLAAVPVVLVAFGVVLRPAGWDLVVASAVVVTGTVVLLLVSAALGVMAADADWGRVARVGILDQLVRSAAIVLAVVVLPGELAVLVAVFLGLVVYVPTLRDYRHHRLGTAETRVFPRRAWAAMVTTGCANLLVVGLPFLVALTGDTPTDVTASLFAAIYLTRSPLLVPANALRPILLRLLLDHRENLARVVLGRLAPGLLLLMAVAALGGWLLGRPLLRAVFGPGYDLSATTMALLLVASVLTLGLTLTGMAMVALDLDAAATVGWVVAAAVTVGALTAPVDVVERCVLAMVLGPAVGIAIHLSWLVTRTPSAAHSSTGRPPRPDEAPAAERDAVE